MYYTHPGCRTSIFGENRAYCIRDFTVLHRGFNLNPHHRNKWARVLQLAKECYRCHQWWHSFAGCHHHRCSWISTAHFAPPCLAKSVHISPNNDICYTVDSDLIWCYKMVFRLVEWRWNLSSSPPSSPSSSLLKHQLLEQFLRYCHDLVNALCILHILALGE